MHPWIIQHVLQVALANFGSEKNVPQKNVLFNTLKPGEDAAVPHHSEKERFDRCLINREKMQRIKASCGWGDAC